MMISMPQMVRRIFDKKFNLVGVSPQHGFTLVELLIVIAIIIVLTVVGVVTFTTITKSARDAKRKADITAMAKAYEVNYTGSYPAISDSNFASAKPKDPRGGDYFNDLLADGSAFRVCAALDGHSSSTCSFSASQCFCISSAQGTYIPPPLTAYGDAFTGGWADWSWDTTRNLTSTTYVHSGSYAIEFTVTDAWGAFYAADPTEEQGGSNSSNFDTTPYTNLRFYINGGEHSNQLYDIVFFYSPSVYEYVENINSYIEGGNVLAGQWRKVDIPLSSLVNLAEHDNLILGFALQAAWQDPDQTIGNEVYIDDIEFYHP